MRPLHYWRRVQQPCAATASACGPRNALALQLQRRPVQQPASLARLAMTLSAWQAQAPQVQPLQAQAVQPAGALLGRRLRPWLARWAGQSPRWPLASSHQARWVWESALVLPCRLQDPAHPSLQLRLPLQRAHRALCMRRLDRLLRLLLQVALRRGQCRALPVRQALLLPLQQLPLELQLPIAQCAPAALAA